MKTRCSDTTYGKNITKVFMFLIVFVGLHSLGINVPSELWVSRYCRSTANE